MWEGRGLYRVLVEKPEGKNHWGDPDVDGTILFSRTHRHRGGAMDGIELAQDRDRWQTLVNVVMNLQVP
jgi:hypothetical protein